MLYKTKYIFILEKLLSLPRIHQYNTHLIHYTSSERLLHILSKPFLFYLLMSTMSFYYTNRTCFMFLSCTHCLQCYLFMCFVIWLHLLWKTSWCYRCHEWRYIRYKFDYITQKLNSVCGCVFLSLSLTPSLSVCVWVCVCEGVCVCVCVCVCACIKVCVH